jgi:FtsZ-binding cell division protein ZapB
MLESLIKLESKIQDGIDTFSELDSICLELIDLINNNENQEIKSKAELLMEILRPDWSSVAFQAWMIGEVL